MIVTPEKRSPKQYLYFLLGFLIGCVFALIAGYFLVIQYVIKLGYISVYTSSAGMVDAKGAAAFRATAKKCAGISIPIVPSTAPVPDKPEMSYCIGKLVQYSEK